MSKAICPKCTHGFDVRSHRSYKGLKKDLFEYFEAGHKPPETWIDESSLVKCPNCGNEFKSEAARFFGFLSPKYFKIFLAVAIFLGACFALYNVFIH